ncbi:DNA-directed DNA polymerase [Senna tora]|uniref:DNA-directed DNA polymerase n=1 Tax=Senna tora TaxID=362788 RepID=A0A834XHS3_9FABA|nr:DNA-directed DNA polymerase [Senna tora]
MGLRSPHLVSRILSIARGRWMIGFLVGGITTPDRLLNPRNTKVGALRGLLITGLSIELCLWSPQYGVRLAILQKMKVGAKLDCLPQVVANFIIIELFLRLFHECRIGTINICVYVRKLIKVSNDFTNNFPAMVGCLMKFTQLSTSTVSIMLLSGSPSGSNSSHRSWIPVDQQLSLGRPFLATGRTLIDVQKGELTMRVQNEQVTFNVFKAMKHPDDVEESL